MYSIFKLSGLISYVSLSDKTFGRSCPGQSLTVPDYSDFLYLYIASSKIFYHQYASLLVTFFYVFSSIASFQILGMLASIFDDKFNSEIPKGI